MASRGQHLVRADRRFATGSGPLTRLMARLAAPAFARLLDQLDRRLTQGGIEAVLPDRSSRRIGFHSPGPVAIVHLRSWRALVRLATSGSVGWYKAWEAGEWASPEPVRLFELFMANAVSLGDSARAKGPARLINHLAHLARDNAPSRARENIAAHYDLGNDFYAAWLDPTMTYSAARFEALDEPLEVAQERKIARLLDRLELRPGERLLEIGCGWGSLAIAAARRGALVVGLTLSAEQKSWAEQRIAEAGLPGQVEIRLCDYRDVDEPFDAVASVEMVEAVGTRWWGIYLDRIAGVLRPGGRAALQLISIDSRLWQRYSASADFIQTYIFPGGMLIDEQRFAALASERGLRWSAREGFGGDYASTLERWRERFDAAVREGALAGFDERFCRLWRYYLMYCEGGFRGGGIDVVQVTLVRE